MYLTASVMVRDAHMSKYTNTHFIHKPHFVYKTNFIRATQSTCTLYHTTLFIVEVAGICTCIPSLKVRALC